MGVQNDEHRVIQNGMAAKGNLAGGVIHIQPNAGLEPLPRCIDERDQSYGCVERPGGQFRQAVEQRLRSRIQHVELIQRGQTLDFHRPVHAILLPVHARRRLLMACGGESSAYEPVIAL